MTFTSTTHNHLNNFHSYQTIYHILSHRFITKIHFIHQPVDYHFFSVKVLNNNYYFFSSHLVLMLILYLTNKLFNIGFYLTFTTDHVKLRTRRKFFYITKSTSMYINYFINLRIIYSQVCLNI